MKTTLDKESLSKARQYRIEKASIIGKILGNFGFLIFIFVICPVVLTIIYLTYTLTTHNNFRIEFFILLILPLFFGFPIILNVIFEKYFIKKSYVIDIEFIYSDERIEFINDDSSETVKWDDYYEWFEREGLLFLYRKTKFFSLQSNKTYDLIDLNKLADVERASFLEMVSMMVKKAQ